jgi:hypothetical protein
MTDDDTPSTRQPKRTFTRRDAIRAAGVLALPVGAATAAGRTRARQSTDDTGSRYGADRSSPAAVARAYVAALDAGNRAAANELIAADGPLEPWSSQAFRWVGGFDIGFVDFRVVDDTGRDVVADLDVRIAGTDGTVRYRFRETEAGWHLWAAVDGLRTDAAVGAASESGPAETVEAYVAALDAGNRAAANAAIAAEGDLAPWSRREFAWVGAFEFSFVDFRTVARRGDEVVGEVTLTVAGAERTLRYRVRETDAGWRLWAAPDGLRSDASAGPAAAVEAYVAALDAGDRAAANELIATDGDLDPWSRRTFEWVEAFDLRVVATEVQRRGAAAATVEADVRLADRTERLTYDLRRAETGDWRVWRSPDGLR